MLTTLSFIPQVIKVVRDKDTKAISLSMYLVFFAGVCLWLFYGILITSWPVIIANSVTILLLIPIIVMKIRLG